MLRRLSSSMVLVLTFGLMVLVGPAAAAPGPDVECSRIDTFSGECVLQVSQPGSGGGGGDSDGSGSGGGGPQTCQADGVEVPCTSEWGSWSNAQQCYLSVMNPMPPPGDPVWQGHTDGALYSCVAAAGNGLGVLAPVWLAVAPPIPVDPAVVAQMAIAMMNLHAVDIGITPEPGPGSMGYVGLPTYMWVQAPSEQTVGPITRVASLGGTTVTATGRLTRIAWNMGDGKTVGCTGPGTPYQDSFGKRPSPTCGHQYTRSSAGKPGDAYPVSATSFWTIEWTSGAANGTENLDFTAQTQIRIGESQVLIER